MILKRQFLTTLGDKYIVSGGLCGIQAQYTKNAYHALRIRTKEKLTEKNWGEGLYKSWTLRGTLHVYPRSEQALFLYEGNGGGWSLRMYLEDPRVSMERKRIYEGLILQRLSQGPATRDELKELCRAGGMTDTEQEVVFHPWGGVIRIMAERGQIVYRAEEKKVFVRCEPFLPMSKEQAHALLMHRYLTYYGPATVQDAAYFFGATQSDIRTRIARVKDLQSEEWVGKTVYYLGERETGPIPECLLLAGFDPLMLGYEKTQSPFLPYAYIRGIFNLTGIVFPAILYRGRVVGRWKEQKGKIELTAFETLTPHARVRIEQTAQACFSKTFKALKWQKT